MLVRFIKDVLHQITMKKNEGDMFNKLWNDADKIEDLMREDLGFK